MKKTLSHKEWTTEAEKRFGTNPLEWKFICPSCGHIASAADWKSAGAPGGAVAFSCVGRWLNADDKHTFQNDGGPCQYAGGGLIGINPVQTTINGETINVFDFAPATQRSNAARERK